jgi:hypothetical protein
MRYNVYLTFEANNSSFHYVTVLKCIHLAEMGDAMLEYFHIRKRHQSFESPVVNTWWTGWQLAQHWQQQVPVQLINLGVLQLAPPFADGHSFQKIHCPRQY